MKPVVEIDGLAFDELDGFYTEVYRTLAPAAPWAGRNLDAFTDVLRGGFGGPEDGFVLRWRHSERSRQCLGKQATLRYLEGKVTRCHPDNVPAVRPEMEAMRRGQGRTLFEILAEIVREHEPGGRESEDGVDLELC